MPDQGSDLLLVPIMKISTGNPQQYRSQRRTEQGPASAMSAAIAEKGARLPTFTRDCCASQHPIFASQEHPVVYRVSKNLLFLVWSLIWLSIHFEMLMYTIKMLNNIVLSNMKLLEVFVSCDIRVFDRATNCAVDALASKWRRCIPLTRFEELSPPIIILLHGRTGIPVIIGCDIALLCYVAI